MLVLPLVFMNLKADQVSDYENKKLADWPVFEMSEDYMKGVYNYVNDRIGFRESAIAVYTEANNALFHAMVNPLFMWGEDGNIYYKDKDYIAAQTLARSVELKPLSEGADAAEVEWDDAVVKISVSR